MIVRRGNRTQATLSRDSGTSLHRQLYLLLRDRIMQGVYRPGESIPNEDALCSLFGVSRITVRRAVADLAARGLLEKRRGRGTFVSMDLPPSRAQATLGLVDALRRAATETDVEVLSVERGEPPPDIGLQLGLSPPARAVHAKRLFRKERTPVAVTEAWVPEAVSRNVTASKLARRPLYELLIEQKIQFGRVVQEITAVAAAPFYARLLNAETGGPLLRLTRLIYDVNRRPVQHNTVHISPERSRMLMDISIDAVNTLAAGVLFHDVSRHTADTARGSSRRTAR